MATIKSYDNDATIHDQDKLIGSDGSTGPDNGKTKNYTVSALKEFILESVAPGSTVISAGDLRTITVTITPTQLHSFNGGGEIEILPQPDAGKAYIVKSVYFHLDFNTTAYNFSGNVFIASYDTNEDVSAPGWGIIYNQYLNSTSDVTTFQGDLTGMAIVKGYPIYLFNPSVSVTQGDSTVKIKLEYQIIDLSL